MIKKTFIRFASAVAVLAVLTLGVPGVAQAAEPAHVALTAQIGNDGGGADSSVCQQATGSQSISNSALLPVNRWTDATQKMHSRLDTFMGQNMADVIQRDWAVSGGMALGNMLWGLGTGMSSFAINFCILDSAGGTADAAAASLGNAILGSPLLGGIVVVSIVGLIWRARRGGTSVPWKNMILKGGVIALLAVVVSGATQSTGGNMTASGGSTGTYRPGIMSPGWIVTTINNTISQLASAPAKVMSIQASPTGSGASPWTCDSYIGSMKAKYQDAYGAPSKQLAAGVPLIMSGMWESSGLPAWEMAQFGGSTLDENAYCHLLDWNAGIQALGVSDSTDAVFSASSTRAVMEKTYGAAATHFNYNSAAFQPTDNNMIDKSIIAWSECKLVDPNSGSDQSSVDGSGWAVNGAYANVIDKKATPADCDKWFNLDASKSDLSVFDWPQSQDDVNSKTAGSLDVRDFVTTLHGNNNFRGLTGIIAYLVSSILMAIVFGGMALATIMAKVAMIVIIIMSVFAILLSLLPNSGPEKIVGMLKALVGMSVFVFGLQLMFAVISVITGVLTKAGNLYLGGPGSIVATFWGGLTPFISVVLIHMVFTKMLKLPSPFKLSGGLAWAGAGAAAGGAAVAGFGGLADRMAGRAASRAGGAAKKAGGAAINKGLASVSGGRLGSAGIALARKGTTAAAMDPTASQKSALSNPAGIVAPKGSSTPNGGGVDASQTVADSLLEDAEAAEVSVASSSGFGHEMLVDSQVANSQLGKGKMSRADRKTLNDAAIQEKNAAGQWARQQREATGLGNKADTPVGRAMDSIANASRDFAKHPFQAAGKTALVGAGVVLTAPVLPLVGLAAAGAYTAKGIVGLRRDEKMRAQGLDPKAMNKVSDQDIFAYREAQKRQRQVSEKLAADAASRKAVAKGVEEGAQPNGVLPPDQQTANHNVAGSNAFGSNEIVSSDR